MKKLLAFPILLAVFGAGCSSSTIAPQPQVTPPTSTVSAPAPATPKTPTSTPTAKTPTPSTKNKFNAPDPTSRTGYIEIYTTRGNGSANPNSSIFTSAGGSLKLVAITNTNNPQGSASTFELKSDNGYALLNTVANAYTKTAGTVTGQTIVQGARAGQYHVHITSTVDWEIHVYQSK